MPKRTSWRAWVLSLGTITLASGLMADVVTVNSVGTGNWSNPSTWNPAVVPNNSATTTYAVGVGVATSSRVAVDISPTVNSVEVSGNPFMGAFTTLEVLNGSTLTTGTAGISDGGIITVDSGGALSANTATVAGSESELQILGTANIRSLSLGLPSTFSVGSGGLANVGSVSNTGGSFSVDGTLNIAANGLTLGPIFSFAGAVTVGTGNLLPLNSPNTLVNNGQIVAPGSFGFSSNDTYGEVIDSATNFGTLSALALSLDGTLKITLADSYTPPVGQSFEILSGTGPLSGTFADIEGQKFNNGTEMWDVTYQSDDVVLTAARASAVPEPSFLVMLGLGLVGIAALSRNRRQQSA